MLCQTTAPIALATGGCPSQARWVGPDGRVRCSLHHIQEFGHGGALIRMNGYEPPAERPPTPAERGEGNG